MFEIFFSNKAKKQYKQLESNLKEKIKLIVKVLSLEPFPKSEFDLKKLKGSNDFYRLRIGTYRMIYHVDANSKKVKIMKIGKRESIYD